MQLLQKISVFLISLLSISITNALPADSFTNSQKKQIEQIVHTYLVQNPSILMEASQALYEQKMEAQMRKMESAVRANANSVFRSSFSPVAGNPKGSITVAEFFDYQCYHCQQMQSTIEALIKENPQLRVVLHNVPLLGANSLLAAQMALAAQLQNKYWLFHESLLSTPAPLDENKILKLAQKIGLNTQQLQSDIKKKIVTHSLKQDYQLVQQMDLDFTPAFVVAKTDMRNHSPEAFFILKGAVSQKEIQSKIDQLK